MEGSPNTAVGVLLSRSENLLPCTSQTDAFLRIRRGVLVPKLLVEKIRSSSARMCLTATRNV